jgi:hypothetical protein
VIEEPVVIVLMLKRHDVRLDEPVELGKIIDEMLGQIEIHSRFLAGCCSVWSEDRPLTGRGNGDVGAGGLLDGGSRLKGGNDGFQIMKWLSFKSENGCHSRA